MALSAEVSRNLIPGETFETGTSTMRRRLAEESFPFSVLESPRLC